MKIITQILTVTSILPNVPSLKVCLIPTSSNTDALGQWVGPSNLRLYIKMDDMGTNTFYLFVGHLTIQFKVKNKG